MDMEGQARNRAGAASTKTIGDVLYADEPNPLVLEDGWQGLVQCVGAGDRIALHALYQWSHRIAFTLALRLLKNREAAAEVTLDVFQEVWRRASTRYDSDESVIGWIANLTRERATNMLRLVSESDHSSPILDTDDVAQPSAALGGRLIWWLGMETGQLIPDARRGRAPVGMERSRAGHILPAALDGQGAAACRLVGAIGPGSRLPASPPCRTRRAASASWRADDQRQKTVSGRLQSRGSRHCRHPRLERDRLHLPADYLHRRRASLSTTSDE